MLAFLIAVTSASFTYYAASDCLRNLATCFDSSGSQLAPFRYRLFEPFLTDLLNPSGTQFGAITAACILFTLLTMLTLPLLDAWLRRWTNEDRAILGACLYSLIQIAAMHAYFISLSINIEAVCVVIALSLVDKSRWPFIPLVIIASLNRESGIVVAAIYAAWWGRAGLKQAAALLAIYLGITATLHIVLGGAEHTMGIIGTLQYNLTNALDGILANLILLPLYWLTASSFRRSDARLQRLAVVAGGYLLAVVVAGSWGESMRLLLPTLILCLPLIISDKQSTLNRRTGAETTPP